MNWIDWVLLVFNMIALLLAVYGIHQQAYARGQHDGYNMGWADGWRSGKESPDE